MKLSLPSLVFCLCAATTTTTAAQKGGCDVPCKNDGKCAFVKDSSDHNSDGDSQDWSKHCLCPDGFGGATCEKPHQDFCGEAPCFDNTKENNQEEEDDDSEWNVPTEVHDEDSKDDDDDDDGDWSAPGKVPEEGSEDDDDDDGDWSAPTQTGNGDETEDDDDDDFASYFKPENDADDATDDDDDDDGFHKFVNAIFKPDDDDDDDDDDDYDYTIKPSSSSNNVNGKQMGWTLLLVSLVISTLFWVVFLTKRAVSEWQRRRAVSLEGSMWIGSSGGYSDYGDQGTIPIRQSHLNHSIVQNSLPDSLPESQATRPASSRAMVQPNYGHGNFCNDDFDEGDKKAIEMC